ncbi:uncharacterized protein AKAME5_001042400, partial [Lates japonicus]
VTGAESGFCFGEPAVNGSSSKDTVQFIASQMILPNAAGLRGCTVVSYYRILLQRAAEYEQGSTDPSKSSRPPETTLLLIPHCSSGSSFSNATLSASGLLSQSPQRSQHQGSTPTPTPPWQQSLGLITSSAEQEEGCSTQDSGGENSRQTDNNKTPHNQVLVGLCAQGASDCIPRDSGGLSLLSNYNMEASTCAQEVINHTSSLMMSLNLQREQAQFCDCVVRQRQSPGQLYPAHRCVLAASSPVLASILSSTGALVELQAPCFAGSVLALVLDYIYTGTLPYTRTQQDYYSLLTAACYLQMDELHEALRAWQQTEANDADKTNGSTGTENQSYKDIITTHCKTANSYRHGMSRADKEVQMDQFHSAGTIKPETWQKSTEEELARTVGNRRNSSSSSSPHPCSGAVPVIRHSNGAAMLQLAEVSPMHPYHPVSQATDNSSRAPVSRSASTDNDSNHYRGLNWSDCHDVSMSAAAEELSQHQRAVVPIPLEDLDTGSDSHCEDLCHEGDTKEEHSYSGGCPAEMNRQDFHSEPFGPKTDWSPKLHRAEKSTRDTALSRHEHEHEHDNRDMAMENKRHIADVGLPVYPTPESSLDNAPFTFERRTSLELEKMSDTKITEPQPVNNITSEPMYNNVGQSYHGHLHYHCLPQEDAHVLHGDSYPNQPDYSDQSSDEEEAGTFASPGCSSLRQRFVTGTTDHVLLLDISAKPAELLVSYKNRCDGEEKGFTFCKNHTFETGIRNNDKQLRNEATSAAGAESFDETKSWVGETNLEERKSIVKDQSMPGTDIIHKSGVVEEVSSPKEGENQKSTLTVCSVPNVPDSVQASMSSTLSVCIPSTLSASVPTNISAHLSTPLHHPFQCSLCDRSFSQRGSLNRHVRSHLGVRPFPCPRCPMTFSRQYRVTEHMRVHQRCTIGNDFHKPPASSI